MSTPLALAWEFLLLWFIIGLKVGNPFDDGGFDAITMGYGLCNVADIPQALVVLSLLCPSDNFVAVIPVGQLKHRFMYRSVSLEIKICSTNKPKQKKKCALFYTFFYAR